MAYQVRLDQFEGPFDLLLFLIHKHEIDIYDIPISNITTQFIDFVENSEHINLVHAGEFIDMVATLMKIKAIMLLPIEAEDDEDYEDPRTQLVERLLEYKQFKEASLDLIYLEEKYEWIRSRSYFKYLKDVHNQFNDEESSPLQYLTLYDLIKAFRRVLDNIPKITEHQVRKISVTIEQQSSKILNYLDQHRILSFKKLMQESDDKIVHVVSFISVLELTKARDIDVKQEELFDDIAITKAMHDY